MDLGEWKCRGGLIAVYEGYGCLKGPYLSLCLHLPAADVACLFLQMFKLKCCRKVPLIVSLVKSEQACVLMMPSPVL